MRYTPNTLFLDSSVSHIELSVGVFIAYEDVAAGKRAKETCDILGENLGEDWRIRTELANLKSLNIPRLRRIAAVEASKANIIFISCNDGPLASSVKQWIRMVVSRGAGPMSLVALFSCPRHEASHAIQAEDYLAAIAKRGRMQFFSCFDSTPRFQWDWNERTDPDLGEYGRRICV
jgi:hypothetical protein